MSLSTKPVRAADVREGIGRALSNDGRITLRELEKDLLPVWERTPPAASAAARAALDGFFENRSRMGPKTEARWAKFLESRGYPVTGGDYYAPPTRARASANESRPGNVTEPDRAFQHVLRLSGFTPADVLLGVVDNEFSVGHPALAGRVLAAHDFADGDQNLAEAAGLRHGTVDAGLALAGAPQLRLVASRADFTSLENMVASIRYPLEQGAKIVNVSFTLREPLATEVLAAAKQHPDVIFTIAAGNEFGPLHSNAAVAAARCPNIAIVGNATQDGTPYEGTSYGPNVTHAAVGSNVFSAWYADKEPVYWYATGTSQAAPIVANVAGKMLSMFPALRPEQALRILDITSDNVPEWSGKMASGGPINPLRAYRLTALLRLTSEGMSPDAAISQLLIPRSERGRLEAAREALMQ